MLSTPNPSPASSNFSQKLTMPGAHGIGTLVGTSLPCTVPGAGCTGGEKVYHGVLMHTGTKACKAHPTPMSGFQ